MRSFVHFLFFQYFMKSSFCYISKSRPLFKNFLFHVQFSSVTQSCPTLCNPMNCSKPGLPVHHQLPESTQTHVHWVSDAVQPSHPLSSPSPPPVNLSQYQCLFQWVSSSHQVVKVSEFQLQQQSFQWTPRTHVLQDRLVVSPYKGLSRIFSNTTIQKHQFFGTSFLYSPTLTSYMTNGKTIALTRQIFVGKVMPLLFNILYRLVITFLPRSKCTLISWLQSPSAGILKPKK